MVRLRQLPGALALTLLCGACAPPECPLLPGLTAAQCETARAMELPAALPASRGNSKADDTATAFFGFKLFFDARLSSNEEIRCATCHVPELDFDDGKAVSEGLEKVTRNSPSIYTAARHRWLMWDGRADSVWSQPLLALENPKEMNFTRLELAHAMETTFKAQYEPLFGALPDLSSFPEKGKPGDAAFDALSGEQQRVVNTIAANVGKAIEAYERKAAHGRGRLDDFLAGDATKLTQAELRGFVVFFKAGCDACHAGPQLSDDQFYDVGIGAPEAARAEGLRLLAASDFSAASEFYEGEKETVPAPVAADEGTWKTPSLRNISRTAPYGHDGAHATLEALLAAHAQTVQLTGDETADLLTFLAALDCEDPPSPWNNWPDR